MERKTIDISTRLLEAAVGKLEGEDRSGLYLSSAYVDRLAEVHNAAVNRLSSMEKPDAPDAVMHLLVKLGQLFESFYISTESERTARNDGAEEALAKIVAVLDSMKRR
jgi:hypothetical protein